jgi:hypothetical protein
MQTSGRDRRPQERARTSIPVGGTFIRTRNCLASGSALAILAHTRGGVPSSHNRAGWLDVRADEGIIKQGNFREPVCSIRARPPHPLSPAPLLAIPLAGDAVSEVRHTSQRLGRSSNCCTRPRGGERTRCFCSFVYRLAAVVYQLDAIVYELDVRRSMVRRNGVNSPFVPALSTESCSKFLNELVAPVNIAYRRRIMSRVCDRARRIGLLLFKEPRVVDATG